MSGPDFVHSTDNGPESKRQNLVETLETIEECDFGGFSWRLLELQLVFTDNPVFVITLHGEFEVEASMTRDWL